MDTILFSRLVCGLGRGHTPVSLTWHNGSIAQLLPRGVYTHNKALHRGSPVNICNAQTLTGELRVALGESRTAVPGGDALPNGRTGARCFRPSRRRTSRMLAGKSSTPQSTSTRHSGQRSSRRELTMLSRQRRQNVCWHGSTLALASSRSRHTEHSSKSNSDDSSIFSSVRARGALTRNPVHRTRRENTHTDAPPWRASSPPLSQLVWKRCGIFFLFFLNSTASPELATPPSGARCSVIGQRSLWSHMKCQSELQLNAKKNMKLFLLHE